MTVWELWPAAVLIVLPLPLGAALGCMADTWTKLRDLRAAIRGDRVPG